MTDERERRNAILFLLRLYEVKTWLQEVFHEEQDLFPNGLVEGIKNGVIVNDEIV